MSQGRSIRCGLFALALCQALSACLGAPGQPASAPTSGADQVLAGTNALRATAGLAPLRPSDVLTGIAQAHAQDMVRRGYFRHRSPDGRGVRGRARAAGYRYCTIGENIAFGYSDHAGALHSWIDSPPHKANLLNPTADEAGYASFGDKFVLVVGRDGCGGG